LTVLTVESKRWIKHRAPSTVALVNAIRRSRLMPRALLSASRSALGLRNLKVFCIGRNKTGTTSVKAALEMLGYRIGYQRIAEALMEEWGRRDFRKLIAYCHTADAFQDRPFSQPYTFHVLDSAFPGSKFILTVRGSEDEWYQSVIRFQALRFEQRTGIRRLPTMDELKDDPYIFKGWSYRNRELSGASLVDPFPEAEMKAAYRRHNETVQDYFRNRRDDLLVLNVADPDAMERLAGFLGKSHSGQQMPKLNQSR
jgi:hypothetical protein